MNALTVGGVFDGVGLLAYGLHLAGLDHRWLCEVDPWRRSILNRRFPAVPIVEDVRAVGAVRCGRVDVIAGGFPCKGASIVGKLEGFGHPETVLWREMARAIGELRPRYVLVENVANLLALHDGAVWGEVLRDLAALGFDVEWDCLPAAAVGAPHRRDRVFAVATNTASVGERESFHAADAEPGGREAREVPLLRGTASTADAERVGDRDGHGSRGVGSPAPADEGAARERQRVRGDAGRRAPEDRGVRVEWGEYEPAIRRWEAVHGAAPEPLVRRVDDRSAARVERSRLSALGDGVQVQVGQIVGEYLMSLEREWMAA